MSIASSILSNVLSNRALDSWHLNFALAQENNVDLTMYEDSVSNTVTSYLSAGPSNILNDAGGVIPIVFHAVMDENPQSENVYKIISPSGQYLDFNINRIIADLNAVYKISGVTFSPIVKNPSGKELVMPGLNIIDGYNLFKAEGNKKR